MRLWLAFTTLLSSMTFAHAHGGELEDLRASTSVLLPLLVTCGLFGLGVARLWHHAGVGSGVPIWRVALFALGMAQLIGIELSPLPAASQQLFTAHMIEHEIIMVTAAPLLVLAQPLAAMLWALPQAWRRQIGSITSSTRFRSIWHHLSAPMPATLLHALALWVWHAPGLYEAALTQPAIHWLQHASFLITALLFWNALISTRAGEGAAVFYLFANALQSGFLGILLAIARAPLFPEQSHGAANWGLTPLEDQQLAGIIMWVPAGCLYTVAALVFAARWISRSSHGLTDRA